MKIKIKLIHFFTYFQAWY